MHAALTAMVTRTVTASPALIAAARKDFAVGSASRP